MHVYLVIYGPHCILLLTSNLVNSVKFYGNVLTLEKLLNQLLVYLVNLLKLECGYSLAGVWIRLRIRLSIDLFQVL